ncbi:hypothetical protein CcI49_32890 [Frankia sp. CcI49]|uniref:hypothetical protein n=1 Tax=Frankia sp. CcI49 TaxID=1745382 RepID=UPI0009762BCB|nr:hypothetical protein [Frankia sp. CcI49]ONH53008.1 hypothetical protein CcI49_32890 [Frankia sp. CcI49]
MDKPLILDPTVLRAVRRYRRRRLLVSVVARLFLLVPAVVCAVMWPPFTSQDLVHQCALPVAAFLGGVASFGLSSDRVTWALDHTPLASTTTRLASHALALHELPAETDPVEAVRLLDVLAFTAVRITGPEDTIPRLAAGDLALLAAVGAEAAYEDIIASRSWILGTIRYAQHVVADTADDDEIRDPDPRGPADYARDAAAVLDYTARSVLALVSLATTPPPRKGRWHRRRPGR